jgi:hypothetical protein
MPEEGEYNTLDEAIAAAMEGLDDGGILTIHSEECESEEGEDDDCTCTPLVLKKGAAA